jgi:uncharacterized damage-inducible protein DinB
MICQPYFAHGYVRFLGLKAQHEAKPSKELLENFDANVAAARVAIASATDEQLFQPWKLLSGGKTVLTLPKLAVRRSFVINHNVHHRAQIGVYLRLNDVPVASIFGPSSDEGGF